MKGQAEAPSLQQQQQHLFMPNLQQPAELIPVQCCLPVNPLGSPARALLDAMALCNSHNWHGHSVQL
jgi:hypothetical protein